MKPAVLCFVAAVSALSACKSSPVSKTAPPARSAVHEDVVASSILVGLPNGRVMGDDLLIGGQPTHEQIHNAKSAGFETIIDLQMPYEKGVKEEAELVKSLDIDYISLPVRGKKGLTEANAVALSTLLKAAAGKKTMLHCRSGNRVAALLGLKRFVVDSARAEDAIKHRHDNTRKTAAPRDRQALQNRYERPALRKFRALSRASCKRLTVQV